MGGYLINFFSADDLIPYGADGAVLAPIAITFGTPLRTATS